VDIVRKEIVWEIPLGSIEDLAPIPLPWKLGTPGGGAPLAIYCGRQSCLTPPTPLR